MPSEIYDFLDSQRVGVVAVEMEDGSPHGATVHFAYRTDPFAIVILTERKYTKMRPLLTNGPTRASFVVGTDERTTKTLQLDGVATLPKGEECESVYFAKFPDKKDKYNSPDDVFFIFTPKWWRFTDYSTPSGKHVRSSAE